MLNCIKGLPFQKVKHQVSTLDAQPTVQDGVVILVTGALLVGTCFDKCEIRNGG
jgi:hypothetical protein